MLHAALGIFVILTLFYWIIALWSRSVRKEKLEEAWDASDQSQDRDEYVQSGLSEYERGFRRKLIWLVYVIPLVIIIGLIYVTNFR